MSEADGLNDDPFVRMALDKARKLIDKYEADSAIAVNHHVCLELSEGWIERGLRAVLDDLCELDSDGFTCFRDVQLEEELPRLVEIFQEAAKADG